MSRRHLYILCFIPTAVGLRTFAYKAIVLNFPILPDEVSELWQVGVKLRLNARPGLNIQIARREGLEGRLAAVPANRAAFINVAGRVAFAKSTFKSRLMSHR